MADHRATDLSAIPDSWRDRAAREVVWAYGSTSHGTQVWTGAHYLDDLLGLSAFSFAKDWHDVPSQTTPARLRMAYDSGWSWDAGAYYDTAAALLADAPQANAFMWSWCGELSSGNRRRRRLPDRHGPARSRLPRGHLRLHDRPHRRTGRPRTWRTTTRRSATMPPPTASPSTTSPTSSPGTPPAPTTRTPTTPAPGATPGAPGTPAIAPPSRRPKVTAPTPTPSTACAKAKPCGGSPPGWPAGTDREASPCRRAGDGPGRRRLRGRQRGVGDHPEPIHHQSTHDRGGHDPARSHDHRPGHHDQHPGAADHRGSRAPW